jgi:1,4-alpha-glucan branching enzyme
VAFRLDSSEVTGVNTVQILGDFNNWDMNSAPMNKLKTNDFTATLELEAGKEYQYRYLIDGTSWKNDAEADAFVTNEFGDNNGVVSTFV